MGKTGTISIRGLEFQARHGATSAERQTLRRFQVDVDLEVDLEGAIAGDRLDATVDYHAVCSIVEEITTGLTFHLVEALAGAILAALGERWPQARATVEVRKLTPPCPGNPAVAAVRLSQR